MGLARTGGASGPPARGAPENRLMRFNHERDAIVADVQRRVTERLLRAADTSEESSLEYVLNDVAFAEIRRYEKVRDRGGKRKLHRWRELALKLGRMSPDSKRRELEQLVRHYAMDVVGNFDPRVYRFANGVLPPALNFLLHPVSSVRDGVAAIGSMQEQIEVEGEVEAVSGACERGTVVFTPTHSSNLDSIALGFGLNRSQLPPVTYGAGKNLFSNPLVSFFMYNLGAYRVDRRLKFNLYKDVLKEYSTVLLERGFHSLFFPGGTRSRSNIVEQRLKLGLLGTAVAAFRNNVLAGRPERRIYVVPVTINYRLVLEAETLIEDYLEETGRSRYIIEDDEFSRVGRVLEFMRKLLAHEGAVVIRLGRPLDPFGNEVDGDGETLDPRGRRIEPAGFLEAIDGRVGEDPQREAVYTRLLGAALARAFARETVFLSTPLLCRALLDALRARTGIRDIYKLMRLPPSAVAIEREEARARIERLRARIGEHPEWGRVSHRLAAASADEVIADAMRVLGSYHTRPVVVETGTHLRVGYMKLLYYYRNRTDHIPEAE